MGAQSLLGDKLIGYAQGCQLEGNDTSGIAAAVALAKKAEVAVIVVGLTASNDPTNSGTPPVFAKGDAFESEGHDRTEITLQGQQAELVKQVMAVNPKTVVVLIHGGALAIEELVDAQVPSILDAHYGGQMGGDALWNTLLNHNGAAPAGRLTTTAYKQDFVTYQNMTDMALTNITYKHFRGTPNWPFGFGLSYSKFEVRWENSSDVTTTATTSSLRKDHEKYFHARAHGDDAWTSSASYRAVVKNVGTIASDYVLLAFVSSPSRQLVDPHEPIRELFDFARVNLAPGASTTVHFSIPPSVLSHIDDDGDERLLAGEYKVELGDRQLGDAPEAVLTTSLLVQGEDQLLFSLREAKAKGAPSV
jgi:hypothetical protein